MLNHTHGPISQLQTVQHAEVSRYMTVVGLTVVFWDHACTFGDEVQFLWTAPRSFVKNLFLGNRYIALACMVLAACQTSRLVRMSDRVTPLLPRTVLVLTGWFSCIASILVLGCFEMLSLAVWDLLLLFRVHALWGGRRGIVISTSVLYCITYVGHAVAGIVGGTQLIPHLYFDPLANTCTADYRPSIYSMLWAFPLFCETIMFILTIIKVLEDRKSGQFNHPL